MMDGLKSRIALNQFYTQKMRDYNAGLDPLEQTGDDEPDYESGVTRRADANAVRQEFSRLVNKIIRDPTDSHTFQTNFKPEFIPYFAAIFPQLQNIFRGQRKPDPRVVLSTAETYAKQKLGAKNAPTAQNPAVNLTGQSAATPGAKKAAPGTHKNVPPSASLQTPFTRTNFQKDLDNAITPDKKANDDGGGKAAPLSKSQKKKQRQRKRHVWDEKDEINMATGKYYRCNLCDKAVSLTNTDHVYSAEHRTHEDAASKARQDSAPKASQDSKTPAAGTPKFASPNPYDVLAIGEGLRLGKRQTAGSKRRK